MPWKERDKMSEKYEFVLCCEEPGANISQICKEFGVVRSTAHKWLKRYREQGIRGLLEQSRRPRSSPLALSGETVLRIAELSEGPRKPKAKRIEAQLRRQFPAQEVPSRSSIHRVLERLNKVSRQRRCRKGTGARVQGAVTAESCNDGWTTDFKGWWYTRDGKRCEPLTIRDEASRYLLDLYGMERIRTEQVQDRFRWCFEVYGLPVAIWSDNGVPFVSARGLCGLTHLSAWFIKIGILPKRIPKASPWCNGGHERMHRDIALEVERYPQRDCAAQQRVFNEWRVEFNNTPHGYLKNRTPEEVYKKSRRRYDPAEPEYEYPRGYEIRKVDSKGYLWFANHKPYLSKALAGEYVGFEQTEERKVNIWFCDYLLGSAELFKGQRGRLPRGFKSFQQSSE